MNIFIDGDPVVYMAAFAAQTSSYHLVIEHKETLEMAQGYWHPDEQTLNFKEYKKGIEVHYNILDQEQEIIVKPLSFALQAIKTLMESIGNECRRHMKQTDSQYRLILSGKTNYRNDISTVLGYKANRKDMVKPVHYEACREYLMQHWGAEIVEGREADDEVSILQRQCIKEGVPCVLATIDKDLDQVPGPHYDYKKKVFYDVAEEEAQLLFYAQAISGDSTDNICGVYRLGDVGARRIVDEIYSVHGLDHQQMWYGVLEAYRNSIEKYGEGCPYYPKAKEEGLIAVALEMARLVKIQEYPRQLWTPPGEPEQLLPATDMDD